jgi:hypothetical protein
MNVARFALLLALGVGLWGCATPRYQTFYRYEPPTDAAARSCLTPCEQTQKTCLDQCEENYSACVRTLEPEAQARHADALMRYEGELAQYRRDLDRYHLSISLGWGHGGGWYGGGWYDRGWYDPWWPYGGYRPYYYPPVPPQPPSYADELSKLSAEECDRDCGCQPNYDACFLACGGRKVPEERCIANCPGER